MNKKPKLNARQATDNIKEQQSRDEAVYFDSSLDPEYVKRHNDDVIARTIKATNMLRRQKQKDYIEQIAERSDAVATYLKSRMAEGNTPVEKYFGREMMAHLTGRKIMNKIQSKLQLHQKVSGKGILPGERKIYLPGE